MKHGVVKYGGAYFSSFLETFFLQIYGFSAIIAIFFKHRLRVSSSSSGRMLMFRSDKKATPRFRAWLQVLGRKVTLDVPAEVEVG